MMEISKQGSSTDDECNNNNPSLAIKEEIEMVVVVVVLPEDLISEIVLRVPPVSVLRFKSVCKSWYSLISNPCFLRNHAYQFHLLLQRCDRLDPPGVLLSPQIHDTEHSVYAILPQDHDQDEAPPNMLKVFLDHSLLAFKQKFSGCSLIDSCNGLLLYRIGSGGSSPHCHRYTVFNPITNQYKEVPLMDLLHTNQYRVFHHPHIVFDPSKSFSYKLLVVLLRPSNTHFELYVYSSDTTSSWRLLTSFTYLTLFKTFLFDGVFYWLCNRDSICFDVVKESVWLLPLPPIPAGYNSRDVLYFGECGGRLRLIEEYSANYEHRCRTFPCSFDIMEMEQGSRIWTMKSRVILEAGYDHLIQHTPLYGADVRVMHLYETEKGEETVLLNVDYKRIVSFNIKTNTFGKELTIPYFNRLDCFNAFTFTPTLFPLLT